MDDAADLRPAAAAAVGTPPPPPLRNRLLAALAPAELEPLRPHLLGGPVALAQGQVLHARGRPVADVFFPEAGLASLTADTLDGGAAEVAMTGREGLVGAAVLLDPEAVATHEAFVQIPGAAWRVPAQALRSAVEQTPALRGRLLRYVQFLMVQTAQAAACNARHRVQERLARWLLMARDRVDGDELALRQEAVSLMLGVRREGRAPRRRERGRRRAAGQGPDPPGPRPRRRARPRRPGGRRLRLLPRRARRPGAHPRPPPGVGPGVGPGAGRTRPLPPRAPVRPAARAMGVANS
jgi:CRP-like cAMP-binding protein